MAALSGAVMLGYPFIVYGGIRLHAFGAVATLLALLALLRAVASPSRSAWAIAAGTLLLAGAGVSGQAWMPLKLYPVLVNGALLSAFAASLRWGPPVVERMARLQRAELPAVALAYTRRVTQVWCGFFLLNGLVALTTALWCDDATWAIYNGGVAYLLIGGLLAGEWWWRRRFLRRIEGSVTHG